MAKLWRSKYSHWMAGAAVGVVVLVVLLVVGLGRGGGGDPEEEATEAEPAELPLRYSGKGSRGIGDLNVPVDAVLEWTNRPDIPDTGFFSVDDAAFRIDVSSCPPPPGECRERGQSRLPKGVYKQVQVDAQGQWTMEIRPGPQRPEAKRPGRRRGRGRERSRTRSERGERPS